MILLYTGEQRIRILWGTTVGDLWEATSDLWDTPGDPLWELLRDLLWEASGTLLWEAYRNLLLDAQGVGSLGAPGDPQWAGKHSTVRGTWGSMMGGIWKSAGDPEGSLWEAPGGLLWKIPGNLLLKVGAATQHRRFTALPCLWRFLPGRHLFYLLRVPSLFLLCFAFPLQMNTLRWRESSQQLSYRPSSFSFGRDHVRFLEVFRSCPAFLGVLRGTCVGRDTSKALLCVVP